MRSFYRTSLVVALGAIFLFASTPVFAGFGVSPPTFEENNAVPGSRFEKTIYLVQGNPERDLEVNATIESKDIKDWISFEKGDSFVIPQGVQQYPFNIIVNVPPDAELGVYKAFVRVTTVPDRATNAGEVAIALGGRIDTTITVGDNVISEYKISGIDILNVQEGDPLQASIKIQNTGNVSAGPADASFELFDKFGNIRLAFINADPASFVKVPSFSTDEITLAFPINLAIAPGEYWGHIKIYNEEGQIVQDLRTVFEVTEGSGLGGANVLGALPLEAPYWAGGVVLVVLILIAGFFITRKPKKRRRR